MRCRKAARGCVPCSQLGNSCCLVLREACESLPHCSRVVGTAQTVVNWWCGPDGHASGACHIDLLLDYNQAERLVLGETCFCHGLGCVVSLLVLRDTYVFRAPN